VETTKAAIVRGVRNQSQVSNATGVALQDEFDRIGAATGIVFRTNNVALDTDVKGGLTWIKSDNVDAIYIASNLYLFQNASALIDGTTKLGIPVIADEPEWSPTGALFTYSADRSDRWPTQAYYLGRILRGAKPSELPIQQPSKFTLIINLKTAKALGITVPQSILARADEVIE
jgi:putative ABC transport system substrate-binding protein